MADVRRIDCNHRVVMPGLIDAHIHAYAPSFNFNEIDRMPAALISSHGANILEGMLQRGFTTVRDAGGGDRGLWMAIEQGLINGPRFFYPGKALSQTGGHGDLRDPNKVEPCACGSYSGKLSQVVDGADAVRKAVREQFQQGAHQIKIMASGGVASPADPMWMNQFTEAEIRAAVEEAEVHRSYVMAHCHTDESIRRCIEYGVRSIEHGSEISAETAKLIAEAGAYVVPTLAVVDLMRSEDAALGLSDDALSKIQGLYESVVASIKHCTEAGVKLGLGTDLLHSEFHPRQGRELALRGEVSTPIEVLRSATSVNAGLLQKSGELGCIEEGAYADVLVLEGNPLEDLSL